MADAKRLKIVVPTDFSECARMALDRALEIARRLPGEIVLVHVVDVLYAPTEASIVADFEAIAREIRKDARTRLATLAAGADPERRLIVRADVVDGRPAEGLVAFAREEGASLIVIGSHGRTGFRRFLLGSVAERVVRLAGCDVLVVHGGERGSHE